MSCNIENLDCHDLVRQFIPKSRLGFVFFSPRPHPDNNLLRTRGTLITRVPTPPQRSHYKKSMKDVFLNFLIPNNQYLYSFFLFTGKLWSAIPSFGFPPDGLNYFRGRVTRHLSNWTGYSFGICTTFSGAVWRELFFFFISIWRPSFTVKNSSIRRKSIIKLLSLNQRYTSIQVL